MVKQADPVQAAKRTQTSLDRLRKGQHTISPAQRATLGALDNASSRLEEETLRAAKETLSRLDREKHAEQAKLEQLDKSCLSFRTLFDDVTDKTEWCRQNIPAPLVETIYRISYQISLVPELHSVVDKDITNRLANAGITASADEISAANINQLLHEVNKLRRDLAEKDHELARLGDEKLHVDETLQELKTKLKEKDKTITETILQTKKKYQARVDSIGQDFTLQWNNLEQSLNAKHQEQLANLQRQLEASKSARRHGTREMEKLQLQIAECNKTIEKHDAFSKKLNDENNKLLAKLSDSNTEIARLKRSLAHNNKRKTESITVPEKKRKVGADQQVKDLALVPWTEAERKKYVDLNAKRTKQLQGKTTSLRAELDAARLELQGAKSERTRLLDAIKQFLAMSASIPSSMNDWTGATELMMDNTYPSVPMGELPAASRTWSFLAPWGPNTPEMPQSHGGRCSFAQITTDLHLSMRQQRWDDRTVQLAIEFCRMIRDEPRIGYHMVKSVFEQTDWASYQVKHVDWTAAMHTCWLAVGHAAYILRARCTADMEEVARDVQSHVDDFLEIVTSGVLKRLLFGAQEATGQDCSLEIPEQRIVLVPERSVTKHFVLIANTASNTIRITTRDCWGWTTSGLGARATAHYSGGEEVVLNLEIGSDNRLQWYAGNIMTD
ncbi:hypothetical protein QBC41DRAFT_341748 [Cercophora samala]|uniref:Uncharacterized protein n=1 Tax=Cercophora samala TaxID=330535 RepID=A0AA39YK96_9PEZI|nr:hypothetical protein QBC41DRAFT_341748 [Cercophora samala]